jgi:hypothetical protein
VNFTAVLWVRIGFNADLDPAFYLNADSDPDPGSETTKPMRIRADPDSNPGHTLQSQKVEIFHPPGSGLVF